MILLHLLAFDTIVPEKAADEPFYKNSHLDVLMSEMMGKIVLLEHKNLILNKIKD